LAELAFGAIGAVAAVGTATTALTAAAIGIQVGSALFPGLVSPKQVIGKINETQIQGASQGASIATVFGNESRIAGNIIYASGLKERKRTSGGVKRPRTETNSYSSTFVVLICKGPVLKLRKIFANSTLIYDDTGSSLVLDKGINPDNLRVYLGTETQDRDPALFAIFGESCPAYRGQHIAVFEDFDTNPYGQTYPNLTFEVDAGACNLKLLCEAISEMSGLNSSQYDFSDLESIAVRGYVIDGRTELRSIFEDLARVYLVDFSEFDGKIVGVKRGGSASLTISWNDLGTGIGSTQSPRWQCTRKQEVDLAGEYSLTYVSRDNNFEKIPQTATRPTRSSQQQRAFSTLAILSNNEARQIAYSNLFADWMARTTHQAALGSKWLRLVPGMPVLLDANGLEKRVRLTSITYEGASTISFSAVEDEASVYTQSVLGGTVVTDTETVNIGSEIIARIFDIPWPTGSGFTPRKSGSYDQVDLFYFVAASDGNSTVWGELLDTVSTFGLGRPLLRKNAWSDYIGIARNALGASSEYVIDRTNTFEVDMVFGELESVSLDALAFGANLAVLGQEIIQFQSAVLIAPKRYRISGIMRGVFGSEWAIPSHAIGDTFVLLRTADGQDLVTQTINLQGAFGVASYTDLYNYSGGDFSLDHRFVDATRDYSGGLPTPVTTVLTSNSRKPWAPVHLTSERNFDDSVDMSWTRRSRERSFYLDLTPSLGESLERYDIEILHPTTEAVLRSFNDVTLASLTYSSANQVTDLGAVGSFKWRVYQKTTAYGIGRGFSSKIASVL
jgi:hypothetical protein